MDDSQHCTISGNFIRFKYTKGTRFQNRYCIYEVSVSYNGICRKEFPKGFFDIVVGAEDVTAHKPNPSGLILAIKHLQSDLEGCLYIGDSIIDAKTAQAIGVDFYGVLNGITTREELLVYPHVKIADNLNDLI